MDSADSNIDYNSKKALRFLDSIPMPLEKSIEGKIADYYALKSIIYDEFEDYPTSYQYNILALEYAEKEENYETAGDVALALFKNIYFKKKDSTAFNYLDKARYYYNKSNSRYGKIDVYQTEAYTAFLNKEYKQCNAMLLSQLDDYAKIDEDAYYNMFALFMISTNYIHLEDFEKAQLYYEKFLKLLNHPTVVPYNYYSFKGALNVCFAEVFDKKMVLDSVEKYLVASSSLTDFMGEDTKRDYFKLYSNYYANKGEFNISKAYIDSLKVFEDKMFENVMDSSFDINNRLLLAREALDKESDRGYLKTIALSILASCLIFFSILWIWNYKKLKLKVLDYKNQRTSLNYLKSNHEKLKVKVKGLEDYIGEVKKEVKAISTVDEVSEQRSKIKELYKNVRLNSSMVTSQNENHLELINDLNVEFFSKLAKKYPQLSDSEVIICYYLYTEFKSKEIAIFLGTSTRAIESKRYRIRKKLNIQNRQMSMFEFLDEALKDKD